MAKIKQVLGGIFIVIGVGLLLGVTGIIPPLSAVSFGPQGVSVSGIPVHVAIKLFVGIILLVSGLILLFPDLKKQFS